MNKELLNFDIFHYSGVPIDKFDYNWIYDENLTYAALHGSKPSGFWVSVGEDWNDWCIRNKYNLEGLTYKYRLKFYPTAQIILLNSSDKILEFSEKRCPYENLNPITKEKDSYEVDWESVKKEYQGIIISPFQWHCRINPKCLWYYGWDCESGCIWDTSCIENIELISSIPVEKDLHEDQMEKA